MNSKTIKCCVKAIVFLQVVVLGLVLASSVHAQSATPAEIEAGLEDRIGDGRVCPCYVVNRVVIEGAFRTRHEVIERELLFGNGEVTDAAAIEESVQRLRNTGLFRTVEYELVEPATGHLGDTSLPRRKLRLTVDERWTLMPSGRIGFGGGVLNLMVGVSETNLFGSYLQAGAQVSRTGPANSFVFWFGDPRFLNERLALTTEVGLSNKQVVFYDAGGERDGGFLRTRKYAELDLEKEWFWWLRTRLRLGVKEETFSYQLISDRTRQEQEAGDGLPPSQTSLVYGLLSRWGRLNFNSFLIDGTTFLVQWMHTVNVPSVTTQGVNVDVGLLNFRTLGLKSTLAFRLNLGFSSQAYAYQAYFLGGLDAVRGFESQRFQGAFYWLGNAEFRIPSVDTRWLAIQHVVFLDAIGVSDYAYAMWDLSGASVGVGLRFMSPKISGLVGRIGYALNLYGGDGPGLSMGGGQFY